MTQDYYSDTEYERKREIRRARVEAEKARQRRNKKLFLGGLILLVLLSIIVFAIIFIVKAVSKKKNTIKPVGELTVQAIEDRSGTDDPTQDIAESVSVRELSGDENSDEASSDNTGFTANKELKKIFELDPERFVYVTDGDTKYIDSEEYLSKYGYVACADTGKVLAQKDGFVKMFPASMTKIMTVLTARMYIPDDHLDDAVTVSYNAIAYDLKYGCTSANFLEGETVTVRDLFYGTILPSGADAAYSLAEYVAGTHEAFVELMNENVEALGLSDTTHFANCVGIYDDMNYSTCNDIAVILSNAMQDEFLATVLGERIYFTSRTPENPDGLKLSNWFIRRIEDKDCGGKVIGAKTGFVDESGCCGASMMLGNDGKTYVCVSGNAWSSWRCIYDHVAAYNIYAIGNTGYHKN